VNEEMTTNFWKREHLSCEKGKQGENNFESSSLALNASVAFQSWGIEVAVKMAWLEKSHFQNINKKCISKEQTEIKHVKLDVTDK